MSSKKMHEGEVEIDLRLVRRLLETQFPDLSELPVEAVESTGTVNAIYRLGDDLCVRLPRLERWADELLKEIEWLPRLAQQLTLAVPEPVRRGEAGDVFPFAWAIYRWMEGETYSANRLSEERRSATDLARFVAGLQRVDPSGAPPAGRKPLLELDRSTRSAIGSLSAVFDVEEVVAVWEASLRAPVWDGRSTWVHCDLLPDNLLVAGGRIRAVIDFGSAGVGDPAQDVTPAWTVFGERGRIVFRSILAVDDPTWARARGYALHQAALIIPYYSETNPAFAAMAKRTIEQILDEAHSS